MTFRNPQTADHETAFEPRIVSALEQQPTPAIPVHFAARVTTLAMASPRRALSPRANYAQAVSLFFSALLLLALFVLAPRAQPSFASLSFDLELAAVAMLAALSYGLTQVRKRSL